jgi:hypothetical protein
LFVRVLNTGILPTRKKAIQSNVSASIVFKTKGSVIDVSKINQGTEFVAEVTVKT